MAQAARQRFPCDLERELEEVHTESFGWAMLCCDWNRETAEDVLQTAYLRALEGRARFDGESTLRTWFFGVVRLVAVEQHRSTVTRGSFLRRWFQRRAGAEPIATPEQTTGDVETRRRLQTLLQRLSVRQRELLHLVFYQDLTIEEAASVLRISVGSARTHYTRGKDRLRRWLTGAGETS